MITIWLITITTLLIGIVLGVYSQRPEKITTPLKKLKRKITKQKLGSVSKLSPTERAKKGTKLEETEDAMSETLDEVL